MDIATRWNKLAMELGFQLKHEIRPFVELPSLHKMAAKAVKAGNLHNAEKLLEHPMIADMLSKTFVGSATGIYRGFEFALFRSTHTGTPAPNPAYFVTIVLLFKEEYRYGIEIDHNDTLSKIKKTIGIGSYVRVPENRRLDNMIAVKARMKDQMRKILANKKLQDNLLNLYQFSNSFEITDRDIRYNERGTIIEKDHALKVMDLMTKVAEVFPSKM
jgi:hypothetical protein